MLNQRTYKNVKAQRVDDRIKAVLRDAGISPKDVPTFQRKAGVKVTRKFTRKG